MQRPGGAEEHARARGRRSAPRVGRATSARSRRRTVRVSSVLQALWGAGLAGALRAQEPTRSAGHRTESTEHRHLAGVLVGGTVADRTTRFTLGLDYERRLRGAWGVGAVADWAFGGEGREFLVAPAGFYHPWTAVRVGVAPGLQRNRETRDVGFVLRLGGEYELELDEGWSAAPNANVDFVDGRTIGVFGVGLNRRF